VVLAAGYAKSGEAKAEAKAIASALQEGVTAPVAWFVVDEKTDAAAAAAAIAGATGIFLTAPDRSLVADALAGQQALTNAVRAAWESGTMLLADNAAAAVTEARALVER
jgi:cyanophycinase-like exopeptidase